MDPELNAYAFTKEGRYFIGVSGGTIFLFDLIFCRMLSDRRILPRVGNVQLETEEPQSLLGLSSNAADMFSKGHCVSPPQCPIRYWYKNRLLSWVFQFIIEHELMHIADGHVDYWKREQGISFLSELGWIGQSPSVILTRQSLETIADSQAAGSLIRGVPIDCAQEGGRISISHSVSRAVIAMCSFFRLFGDATFTKQNLAGAYPPLRVRQMMCLAKVDEEVQTWDSAVRETCRKAITDAVFLVERVFALLTGKPTTFESLRQAHENIGLDHGEKLVHHIKTVTRPTLQSFAYHDVNL